MLCRYNSVWKFALVRSSGNNLSSGKPGEDEKQSKLSLCSVLCLIHLASVVLAGSAGTQFASHVSVNTPARSFTHGVGDPLPTGALGRRSYQLQLQFGARRPLTQPRHNGYPRVKPTIPFDAEEVPRHQSPSGSQWQYNKFSNDVSIPILSPSPYKVDSPDPESLWPEGLFLPPISPPRFALGHRRSDTKNIEDPYLLEGSEAIAAVTKAKDHGELYFHDIPHIESLLANQELRIKNNLKPHVLGSIRHTWPFYRY